MKKLLLILGGCCLAGSLGFGVYLVLQTTRIEPQGVYGQLKPSVTTTLNTKRFVKTSTSTPLVRIEDKLIGAQVTLPVTVVTTNKGNELLVLINKKIRLPASYVPSDLVPLNTLVSAPSGAFMRKQSAQDLKKMFDQAKAEGVNLTVVSAYRSYFQQINVFNGWVASAGLKSAESFSARAGHSQHQLGTAVDIGAVGKATFSEGFGNTPEGKWLANNSNKFGFVMSYPKGKESITGYSYEPWHFRYIGVENASAMVKTGLILEKYLQKFGTW